MATTKNVKEIGTDFESDPRTVRKFLRDTLPKDEQPGKGGRYAIEAHKVRSLKKQFITWSEERTRSNEQTDEVEEVMEG